MDLEKIGGENELDLARPGFKFDPEKHKKIIDTINNLVMPVFEKVNKHPENNSNYKFKRKQFLGAHPISLEKKHLREIRDFFGDFLVCEKSDGTRYLLYISNYGEAYLSGRGDDFYLVNISVHSSMVDQKAKDMSIMYIFDGELVIDKREGKDRLVYLLFDCLMFHDELVFDKTYLERLKYCLQFVTVRNDMMNLARECKCQPIISIEKVKKTKQPRIKVCVKDFYTVDSSTYIFNKMTKKLPHENDGLIFTRNSKPYPVGATSNIIKWKPPDYNTVDFMIVNNVQLEEEYGKTVLDLYVTRYNRQTEETDYVLFDVMIVDDDKFKEIGEELEIRELGDDIPYKNGSDDERKKIIAECKFDEFYSDNALDKLLNNYLENSEDCVTQLIENSTLSSNISEDEDIRNNIHLCFDRKIKMMKGNWIIWRVRKDKLLPNAFNTAKNVFNCVFENIQIDDLDKEVQSIISQAQQMALQEAQGQVQTQAQPQGQQNHQQNGRHEKPRMDEEPGLQKKAKTDQR